VKTNEVLIGWAVAGPAAIRTVELAMEVAAGAGFYRELGLEQLFRDVQGARNAAPTLRPSRSRAVKGMAS
jgi:alkylation response protein AidB-like acyl-CoA dehydrogenase